MNSGIYCLVFKDTDKVYIGKSINLHSRKFSHLYCMRKGISSKKLQEAYNTFGEPDFQVLQYIEKYSELNLEEKLFIEEFDSVNNGFNSSQGGEAGALLPGDLNGRALFPNEKYLEVLELLSSTSDTIKQIAHLTGTSTSIVGHISSGDGHTWLKEAYPSIYQNMLSKKHGKGGRALATIASKRKFNYVHNPEGLLYQLEGIKLAEFCNHHLLTESKLSKLLNGHTTEYLGWYTDTTPKKYKPPQEVVDPDGIVYKVYYGKYTEFAKAHGLDPGAFRLVLSKKANHHHGWTLNG